MEIQKDFEREMMKFTLRVIGNEWLANTIWSAQWVDGYWVRKLFIKARLRKKKIFFLKEKK